MLESAGTDSDDPGATIATTLNAELVARGKKPAPTPKKKASLKTRFNLIVKPDCMSQGKGIFLTNTLEDIKEFGR